MEGKGLSLGCLGFLDGEINGVDGVSGTLVDTLLAELTFLEVDISKVGGDGDTLGGTNLGTLAAADTGHFTFLHCDGTLLLVGAGYIDTHAAGAFVAELDDRAGTSLCTGATSDTFVFDHARQAGSTIYLHGTVGAGLHTVATSETSVGTCALARAERGKHRTRGSALEAGQGGTEITGAVTLEHGDLGLGDSGGQADDVADLLHDFSSRGGAGETVEGSGTHAGYGKVAATAASASATVGTWQQCLYLVDAWILVDMKLLSHEIKHGGSDDSYESEDDDG